MGYICSIAEVDCPCKLIVEVDCPETSRRLILRNPRLDRALSDVIELTSRDAFLIDGSKPNQAVYASASAGCIGSVPGDWRGPIVVLRGQGLSIGPNTYTDVTLDDFRHLMDYFIRYRE